MPTFLQAFVQRSLPQIRFLLWLPIVLSALTSWGCTPHPEGLKELSSNSPSEKKNSDQTEIVWAGLSGNPPKYFDTGDNKGLGYLEVQTKLVRKALTEAGYSLRYEYYSPARMEHEFNTKSPICFYPFNWKNPKAALKNRVDRVFSIPLNLSGEERRFIIVRKADLRKFDPFLDKKGNLNIQSLLASKKLKTVIPMSKDLGEETQFLFGPTANGSIDVLPQFQDHIDTRVLRDNNQMIQMLNGDRIDYLLGELVETEDYQAIRSRRVEFETISYQVQSLKGVEDPRLILSSVACSLHPRTIEAMPTINEAISKDRDANWLLRNLRYQKILDPNTAIPTFYASTLQYRFLGEIAQGRAESWYPLLLKQVPGLRIFPEKKEVRNLSPIDERLRVGLTRPKWAVLNPRPGVFWIGNEVELHDIQNLFAGAVPMTSIYDAAHTRDRMRKFFTSEEWKTIRRIEVDPKRTFPEFELALKSIPPVEVKTLTLLARGVRGDQIESLVPILKNGALRGFSLIYGGPDITSRVIPALPSQLEELALPSSSLGTVELASKIASMTGLKRLNLTLTQMAPGDLGQVLLDLPSSVEHLAIGWQLQTWTPDLAKKFGKRNFQKLKSLDLENSGLDDRHCEILQTAHPKIESLGIGLNFFTTRCLTPVFATAYPQLQSLDLNGIAISTLGEANFKIPNSVRNLDLSRTGLSAASIKHIQLPEHLTVLRLYENQLDAATLQLIGTHLNQSVEELDLSNNPLLAHGVFSALERAKVSTVGRLDLSGVPLSGKGFLELEENKTLSRVSELMASNTGLSNTDLKQISKRWGEALTAISLNGNRVSKDGLAALLANQDSGKRLKMLEVAAIADLDLEFLSKCLPKNLVKLDLADNGLTDRDLQILAPHLPKSLKFLNLSGSLFKSQGMLALSEHMPNLIELSLPQALGDSSWEFLAAALPPWLKSLVTGPEKLSEKTARLLLKNIPPQLAYLSMDRTDLGNQSPSFFSQLPNALLEFRLLEGTPLPDSSASALASSWPRNLQVMMFYSSEVSDPSLRLLIQTLPPSIKELWWATPKGSPETLKILFKRTKTIIPAIELSRMGVTKEAMEELNQNMPFFIGTLTNSSHSVLATFRKESLSRMKLFYFATVPFTGQEIVGLLKKLPPEMLNITFRSTALKYEDVDPLIAAIPPGLRSLDLGANEIGPAGFEKLRAYQKRIETVTGLPFTLITE